MTANRVGEPRPEIAAAPERPINRGLDILESLCTVAAVFLFFNGRVQHPPLVLFALAVPASRWVLSPAYRVGIRAALAARWAEIGAFRGAVAPGDSRLPGRAHGDQQPADAPACVPRSQTPLHCSRGSESRSTPRIPWRAALRVVVVPVLLIYLFCRPDGGSGDTRPVIPAAAHFVTHGNVHLDEYLDHPNAPLGVRRGEPLPYNLWQQPAGLSPDRSAAAQGGVYSGYPAGMLQFAVPMVALAKLSGADLFRTPVIERLEKWVAACIAAACAGLFFLIALHVLAPRPAAALTALFAVTSSMFSTTAQALWQSDGVIFWMLVFLIVEFRAYRVVHLPAARRVPAAATLLQGIGIGGMLACRLSSGVIAVGLVAWILLRSPKRAVVIAAIAAVALSPWLWFYRSVYGTPLGPWSDQVAGYQWSGFVGEHIIGVLFSPARGFLVYHPWLVLLALLPMLGIRRHAFSAAIPGWTLALLVPIAAHIALVSTWGCWWGGYCWGPRLAVEALPLAALLCAAPVDWLMRRRAGRAALIVLAAAALFTHWPGVYTPARQWNRWPTDVDQDTQRLWSWRDAPFLFPFRSESHKPPKVDAAEVSMAASGRNEFHAGMFGRRRSRVRRAMGHFPASRRSITGSRTRFHTA